MSLSRLFAALVCCLLLSSCAQLSQYQNNRSPSLSARDYLDLAQTAAAPQKQQLQFKAAEKYLQNRQTQPALAVLNQMDTSNLTPQIAVEKQLLMSEAMVINKQYTAAMTQLNGINSNNIVLSQPQQIQWYTFSAQAYLGMNQPINSISLRDSLASLLTANSPAYKQNLQTIWEILQNYNNTQLQTFLQQQSSPVIQGWIQLAMIVNNANENPQQLSSQITAWQSQYPNHMANQLLPKNLTTMTANSGAPKTVALLLPLSGKLASNGNAIKNGFLATYYYWKQQYNPHIIVIDTAKTGIVQAYQSAVKQGANFVIGPLTKSNLQLLINNGNFPVPTLALNTISDNSPAIKNLYTFGLSPLDEATQAANKAWQNNHNRAIVITPDSSWGQNIASQFDQRWTKLGGRVVAEYNYDQPQSLERNIEQLMDLDQSKLRARNISQAINAKVRSIPRRRKDFDSIFLVANSRMGRQIQPLLQYYFAGNIPVYAISPVYQGTPDIIRDRDLDHVLFCDIPWVLNVKHLRPAYLASIRSSIQQLWPSSLRRYPKLYALGIDAFDTMFKFNKMLMLPDFGSKGATGTLYITKQQHVYRQLPWATFKKGRVSL